MKEELTTAMHSEFTLSEETTRKHAAWAAFQLVTPRCTLAEGLDFCALTIEDVRPYVEEWNALIGQGGRGQRIVIG